MKWIAKDNKMGLNIDLISFWKYTKNKTLLVYVGCEHPIELYDNDAEEVYALLTTTKQII